MAEDIRPAGQWRRSQVALPVHAVQLPRLVMRPDGWYEIAESGGPAAFFVKRSDGFYEIDPQASRPDTPILRTADGFYTLRW